MKRPRFDQRSGVYIIICRANLKMYIGSSNALAARFSEHRSELRRSVHPNAHLQNAWAKYGEKQFTFGVLEYVSEENNLFSREQYYLDTYRPFNKTVGFNISPTAEGVRGIRMSDECKEAIRRARTGCVASPETVQRLKDAWVENYDEWQQQSIDQRGVSFEIVSPDGVLHTIRGLKRFAREHDLDPAQLARVLKRKGRCLSVGGWHLPDVQLQPPRYLLAPDGTVHTIPHLSLRTFATARGLKPLQLGLVLRGKKVSYQGWTRADDPGV